ncbi:MAG: polysaccharide deacetylase family protein [Roseburia sp.]|nr:polysaccharide deacetylase family protein [Roseburia sp.]MCM1097178.1 polysaccharide deacetylase family protein [Ruminococcus flavefaciens]
MSEKSVPMSAARRQRIQKLKKGIVRAMAAGTAAAFCLCIVMLALVCRMGVRLNRLTEQTEVLAELLKVQQEQLEELLAERSVEGQGNPVVRESGREIQGQTQGTLPEKPEAQEGEAGKSESAAGAQERTEGSWSAEGAEDPENSAGAQERTEGSENAGESEAPEDIGGEQAAHRVYLTFDDGPSAYTDDILDILDQYGVKATFFVVGKETDSAKAALQDIVARGHTLGMHSYSHKYSEVYHSVEDFAEDFTKLRDYLYEVTGVTCDVYRFPGGSSNTVSRIDMHEFADYLAEQEVEFFDWNIASGDGGKELLSVDTLVKNCTGEIEKHGTSVILLHDSVSKKTTVEALPDIIETILAMEDTEILPITEDTEPVHHIR